MIDLSPFCADGSCPRTYLHTPWTHLGYRYASNAHIMIRVKSAADAETFSPILIAQDAANKFEKSPNAGYAPLPAFSLGPFCQVCKGSKTVTQRECDDCDGDGTFFRGKHEYDCQNCDTSGFVILAARRGSGIRCEDCDGHGHSFKSIAIDGAFFEAYYLSLIDHLPGVMFAVDKNTIGYFRFNGGSGILMYTTRPAA